MPVGITNIANVLTKDKSGDIWIIAGVPSGGAILEIARHEDKRTMESSTKDEDYGDALN